MPRMKPFAKISSRQTMSEEADSNLRYKLPHYGTPTTPSRRSLTTPDTPGTPDRPIVISDDSTAGTSDEPIYVSDLDATDNESETDASNIAIRGVRKAQPSRAKAPPSKNLKEIVQKRNKAKESGGYTRGQKSLAVAPNIEGRSKMISAKPTMQQTKKLSTQNKSQKHKSLAAKDLKTPLVDFKALSKGEDPILEQELEEIALNWRVGAISGTPSGYDVEKGKQKEESLSSLFPPASLLDEDDADRSWHNGISGLKPKDKKRQRWYLFLSVTGLLVITGCLIYVMASNKNNKLVKETEPNLTNQQQAMHDLIVKVTDASILKNPNSPQYHARRWLLFRDRDSISDEAKIIQRYVLACFYFSTGGNEKWKESNWMSGSECGENPWSGLSCTSDGVVRALVLGTFHYFSVVTVYFFFLS